MRGLLVVLATLAVPSSLLAQLPGATEPVSVSPVRTGLKPAQMVLLVGGALAFTGLFDDAVHEELQEWRSPTSNSLARIGNKFGTGQLVYPALITAWVAGTALGSDGLRKSSGHALVAATAAGLAVTALKWTIGRARPSSGFAANHYDVFEFKDSSFPSGHTALAFSVASSLSRDIRGRWDDVALYGAATLTGLARMNDNKHWLSDVVGGAVVGILAGKWATRGNRQISAGPGGVGVSLQF